MRTPMLYKIAAGIAIVVVATPTAVYFVDRLSEPRLGGIVGQEPLPRADRHVAESKQDEREFPAGKKLIYDERPNGIGGESDRSAPQPAPDVAGTEKTDQSPVAAGRTLEERIKEALKGGRETGGTPPAESRPAPSPETAGPLPGDGKLLYDRLDGTAKGVGAAPPVEPNAPAKPDVGVAKTDRQVLQALRDAGKISRDRADSSNGHERLLPEPPVGRDVAGVAGDVDFRTQAPSTPNNAPSGGALSGKVIQGTERHRFSQNGENAASGRLDPAAKPEGKVAGQFGETRLDTTLDAGKHRGSLMGDDAPTLNAPNWNAAADKLLDGKPEPSIAPPSPPPADQRVIVEQEENRDQFKATAPNPVKQVAAEPVSTFSVDVDTASYSFVRRALNEGRLPPKDAVRVEEMINYFPYDYPRPTSRQDPFAPTVTVMPAPWKPTNKLIHIGIKGYDIVPAERPRANIVLLIDISGSMMPADRLPLVKNAFRMLVDELKPDDTVGIVTYASGSGVALEPTRVANKARIIAAIDALGAGGSTAGAQGISDAYRLAEAHFDKTGVNRIILATDGDFNVGISNPDELKGFIERKRKAGIFLSILGVGRGNYNDSLMQTLAQNGNGTAAYVDTLNEARKVLVDEASSTLFTIAKDVKIQMEFNPAAVSEYRLIGYETRALRREDFNNDKVDAGDIGSGHTVTAIYEVTPVGVPKLVDDLRYGQPRGDAPAAEPATANPHVELGFLKLRYKLPKEDTSQLLTAVLPWSMETPDIASAPDDVRFSVAVAGFGQMLRGLPYVSGYGYDDVLALAQTARGPDPFGYRAEFLNLVRLAKSARP